MAARHARHRVALVRLQRHAAHRRHVGREADAGVVGQVLGHVLVARGGARHQQGRALGHQHPRRDAVDLAQPGLAHADLPGRVGGLHRAGHDPGRPRGQRAAMLLEVGHEGAGVVVGQQQLAAAGRQDHRLVHRRIELAEGLLVQLGQLRGTGHVDVAVDVDRQEVRMVGHRRQFQAVGRRAHHDVLHRLQLGQVVARLVGHAQALVVDRQPGLLVARHRLADVALAPVVGGQRQLPVAVEQLVQALQVVQRGLGRGQHVAAVVAEDVLLEVEVPAGGGHELPHADGLGAGLRVVAEGALDEGQQRQLHRHAALLDLLDHVVQVQAAAAGHARDVVGPAAVPVLGLADQVVVELGHRHAGAHPRPQVDMGLGRVQVDLLAGVHRVLEQHVELLFRRGGHAGHRRRGRGHGRGGRFDRLHRLLRHGLGVLVVDGRDRAVGAGSQHQRQQRRDQRQRGTSGGGNGGGGGGGSGVRAVRGAGGTKQREGRGRVSVHRDLSESRSSIGAARPGPRPAAR